MTAAQKNAKAMKLLKRMFNELGPMAPWTGVVAETAAFIGDKRFSRGTVEVSTLMPGDGLPFDDLQDGDEFTAELIVTNSRTGKSSSVEVEVDYFKITIERFNESDSVSEGVDP